MNFSWTFVVVWNNFEWLLACTIKVRLIQIRSCFSPFVSKTYKILHNFGYFFTQLIKARLWSFGFPRSPNCEFALYSKSVQSKFQSIGSINSPLCVRKGAVEWRLLKKALGFWKLGVAKANIGRRTHAGGRPGHTIGVALARTLYTQRNAHIPAADKRG